MKKLFSDRHFKGSIFKSSSVRNLIAFFAIVLIGTPIITVAQGSQCSVTQLTSTYMYGGSSGNAASAFATADGKRIVFSSDGNLTGNDPDHNGEIYFYDLAGGFTQITDSNYPGIGSGGDATISSDGKRVAFLSMLNLTGENADLNDEIFLYDADTGTISQVTTTTGYKYIGIGVISANGQKIAFSSERDFTGQNADGNVEIFTFNIQAGSFSQITDTTGSGTVNALWSISGDGKRLSIASNADLATNSNWDLNWEIFVHDESTGFIEITYTFGPSVFNHSPFLSEDGQHIAFASNNKYPGNSDGNYEEYIFDLNTSALTQLTNSTSAGNIQTAAISGDGDRVVFIAARNLTGKNADLNGEIFMVDRSEGTMFQISDTLAPATNYRAEISTDGKRIFWDSNGNTGGNADGNQEMFMAECAPPPSADLLIGSSADRLSVKQGEKLTYTITVTNNGPDDALALIVNDTLSSGATFVSAQVNKGTFTAPSPGQTGTVTWYPGDLANGSSSSAQIKVTVIAKGKTSIVNTASVTSSTGDPNTANNNTTISTVIASGTGGGGKK